MRETISCVHIPIHHPWRERKDIYRYVCMYVCYGTKKKSWRGRTAQKQNAQFQWNLRVLKLRDREAMDDQPSIIPRRGRREREDLVRSSSLSSPPWAMLMCAYFFFFLSLYPTLTLAQETESDLFTLYNTTCGGDSVKWHFSFPSKQSNIVQ